MAIDPKQLAMQVAINRWKRFPNDPIAKQLDEADECVQEASLMNKFLPPFMAKKGFAWQFITPQEIFRAKIQLVRNYAGLVFTHMAAVTPAAEVADLAMLDESAESMSISGEAPSTRDAMELFAPAMSEAEREGLF